MAKKDGLKFDFKIDPTKYKWNDPEKIREARRKAVQAAGMVWADETKSVVKEDDHIDTSLYINSIGYLTDYAFNPDKSGDNKTATEADVINELIEGDSKTTLRIGSAVGYAEALEKRYNIFARGLDRARPRMKKVGDFQIQKTLGGEK